MEKGCISPDAGIRLLELKGVRSLASQSEKKTAVVFGFNEISEFDKMEAGLKGTAMVTPFYLKDTNRFASMYAMESKTDVDFKYADALSPYYVYGDGPF